MGSCRSRRDYDYIYGYQNDYIQYRPLPPRPLPPRPLPLIPDNTHHHHRPYNPTKRDCDCHRRRRYKSYDDGYSYSRRRCDCSYDDLDHPRRRRVCCYEEDDYPRERRRKEYDYVLDIRVRPESRRNC